MVQERHSGPLPSGREFRLYESVQAGAADRILKMAELEQSHRHGLEAKVVKTELSIKGNSQWFALAALLASLGVVGYFVSRGHPIEGASFGGAVIAAVIALFLGQKWLPSRQSETNDDEAAT